MRRLGLDDLAARDDLLALRISAALGQLSAGTGVELEVGPPSSPVLVVHDGLPNGEHGSRKGNLELDGVGTDL